MRWTLLLFYIFPVFGAYVGNPASPGIMNMGFFSGPSPYFKFTSGYLADYTSNKQYQAVTKSGDEAQNFHDFALHSQMATFSAIFVERLEIFGAAGGSKEHAKWDRAPTYKDYETILDDFKSKYTFSWAAGAKVILIRWWQTYLGADFTYFDVPSSQKSFFKFLNRLNLPMDTEKQPFSIQEWQVSLGLSSRIFILTPYGGITYLRSKLNIESGADVPPLYYENKDRIGYFYGGTISLTGRFHLNFERRVRDEFSYSLAAIAVF